MEDRRVGIEDSPNTELSEHLPSVWVSKETVELVMTVVEVVLENKVRVALGTQRSAMILEFRGVGQCRASEVVQIGAGREVGEAIPKK
jgi:hypothetical protein